MMANVVILTETFGFIEQSRQIIAQQWAVSLNTNVLFSCKGEAAPFAQCLVLSFATYSLVVPPFNLGWTVMILTRNINIFQKALDNWGGTVA